MKAWGAPPVFETIPTFLRTLDRWVVWAGVRKGNTAKFTKMPYQPAQPRKPASTRDPAHWSTFDLACQCYRDFYTELSGIGFVLTHVPGLPPPRLIAIDLDRCTIGDSRLTVVRNLGMYVEHSPSLSGFRALGFGIIPWETLNTEVGVEIYDGRTPRYVTITGREIT